MPRTFHVMGENIYFGSQLIATLAPNMSATIADEVTQFLDGLTLDVIPEDELQKIIDRERADAHAEGLSEGYDKGHADGYATGYKTGAGA